MSLGADGNPAGLEREYRNPGVRRLNRVPLIMAGLMLLLILGAVTYTYQMRLADLRRKAAEARTLPEPVNLPQLFPDAPGGGLIPANRPAEPPKLPAETQPQREEPPAKLTERLPSRDEERDHILQMRRRLAEQRHQRLQAAIAAPTRLQSVRSPAQRQDTNAEGAAGAGLSGQIASLYAAEAARQRSLAERREDAEGERDINRAAEKRAFLAPPQIPGDHRLPGGREAPFSPYEVKAGTIIPAIMIGGVNSDLPGQILGQVTQNVYDSATGRYVLIPQGAKLIGSYDNSVTTGQERVLVAWTRIIYPDGSSLDLGKMPGTDQSGFAGFHDKVDNHLWKALGNALLMSVFTAGIQISQGGQNTGANGLNAQQSVAAGLGQQLGQLGQEMARRNTQIQPTLEIRPGYRFTVMVTKDMGLRPWLATGFAR